MDVFYTTDEAGNIFNEPQKPLFRMKITGRGAKETAGVISFRCTVRHGGRARRARQLDRAGRLPTAGREVRGAGARSHSTLAAAGMVRGCVGGPGRRHAGAATADEFRALAARHPKGGPNSPFGVWCFFTSHTLRLESGDKIGEKLLPIMRKAGWRWTYGGAPPGQARGTKGADAEQKDIYREIQQKYKLMWTLNSPYNAYQRASGWFDAAEFQERVVPAVRNALAKGIDCCFKVLHELRSSNTLVARLSEFLGGKPYDMPADEKARVDEQFPTWLPIAPP